MTVTAPVRDGRAGGTDEFLVKELGPGGVGEYADLDIEKKFLQLTRIDTEQFRYFYEKYHDVIFRLHLLENRRLRSDRRPDRRRVPGGARQAGQVHLAGIFVRRLAVPHRAAVGQTVLPPTVAHPAEKVFESNVRHINQSETRSRTPSLSGHGDPGRDCMRP